jgi:hypothetical protein
MREYKATLKELDEIYINHPKIKAELENSNNN